MIITRRNLKKIIAEELRILSEAIKSTADLKKSPYTKIYDVIIQGSRDWLSGKEPAGWSTSESPPHARSQPADKRHDLQLLPAGDKPGGINVKAIYIGDDKEEAKSSFLTSYLQDELDKIVSNPGDDLKKALLSLAKDFKSSNSRGLQLPLPQARTYAKVSTYDADGE